VKNTTFKAMTVDKLIEHFVGIGLAQDEALLDSDLPKFNRLFDQMQAVAEELKSRPGDQRDKLLSLYDHPNAQVRLKAAKATLAVAPAAARAALQTIAESHEYPQAGDAGMTLANLERGVFKPT
jgi:Domain of unknown function (DUF2019)